jgi:hypothetical protein
VVDFGDKVIDLLLRDANRFNVERGTVDDGASGARSLDGHVEHGVEIGRHELCEELNWPTHDRGGEGRIFSRKVGTFAIWAS